MSTKEKQVKKLMDRIDGLIVDLIALDCRLCKARTADELQRTIAELITLIQEEANENG